MDGKPFLKLKRAWFGHVNHLNFAGSSDFDEIWHDDAV